MGKTIKKDIPTRREIAHLDASMRHSAGAFTDESNKRSHNKYLKLMQEEVENNPCGGCNDSGYFKNGEYCSCEMGSRMKELDDLTWEASFLDDFDPDHPKYKTHN